MLYPLALVNPFLYVLVLSVMLSTCWARWRLVLFNPFLSVLFLHVCTRVGREPAVLNPLTALRGTICAVGEVVSSI